MAVTTDTAYSHLIVAYGKENPAVRFVTAVAKDDGPRVRYADVVDTGKAQQTRAGNSTTYRMEVPARDGQPGLHRQGDRQRSGALEILFRRD